MNATLDHLHQTGDATARGSGVRIPAPTEAPALVRATDPRLGHPANAAPALLALQRTAGNAAVASLVAGRPLPVQRDVSIDEIETTVGPTPGAGGGPVTSDGASTTVSGSTITLAAPVTTADGVLRAQTIIADSIVASSYSPGAGNLW